MKPTLRASIIGKNKRTMITDKLTYRWLWSCLIAGGLLLTGCADSSEGDPMPEPEPEQQGSPLELRSFTRTEGATEIGDASCPDIRVYLTTATEMLQFDNQPYGTFHYSTTNNGWESNLSVKEERQYYLYGYMPADISNNVPTPTDPDGTGTDYDFSDGIDLTLNGLPAITTTDICVVIGVQRLESENAAPANVKEGDFSYLSGIVGKNYVNLLMGHLYAGLELQFKIGSDYAQLRSIRLKEIKLKYANSQVNATVKLRKDKGIDEATFTDASGSEQEMTILSTETVLDKNYINSPLVIPNVAYCYPSIFGQQASLSITTKYDVYDKNTPNDPNDENDDQFAPIRKDCISTNKLRIEAAALKPGQKKAVILTVQPTYLYVLSDEDLDNPVITIN